MVLQHLTALSYVFAGVPSKASNGTILSPHEWPNKSGTMVLITSLWIFSSKEIHIVRMVWW